jgi:predicted phosphoribosyltransferase
MMLDVFRDRTEAGELLAQELVGRVQPPGLVLGIPRGGVLVALPVARSLGFPLDVVVPRKIGAPFNPELGLGAIAPGVRVLDERLIRRLRVSQNYLEREIDRQEREIDRRMREYRHHRPAVDLTGLAAVLVDDGVATGGTALASIRWAWRTGATTVVFAAPVAPPETARILASECTEATFLQTPARFLAVGEWYERFDQVSDDEVREALAQEHA